MRVCEETIYFGKTRAIIRAKTRGCCYARPSVYKVTKCAPTHTFGTTSSSRPPREEEAASAARVIIAYSVITKWKR